MPAVDPLLTAGAKPWTSRRTRARLLLWLAAVVALLGLAVLAFCVYRNARNRPESQVAVPPPASESQPSTAEVITPAALPPAAPLTTEVTTLPTSTSEAARPPEMPFSQPPTTPAVPPTEPGPPETPPPPSPTELAVQFVGEPDLRVDSTYEMRKNDYGGVTGLLVRGTVSNPSQNRIERVVLTFTATGAIVVSQATYESLMRSPPAAVPATAGPYWNPEVILAYQASVLPNLAPGETRPFEFVAPINLRNPPGLKSGEVVQAGQPLKASLLVRSEGVSPSGTPLFPLPHP